MQTFTLMNGIMQQVPKKSKQECRGGKDQLTKQRLRGGFALHNLECEQQYEQ